MIHTNRKTNVFDVQFIPAGLSEPETHRLDAENWTPSVDPGWVVEEILDEYEARGEVLGIWYIGESNERFPSGRQLYGNRRYE